MQLENENIDERMNGFNLEILQPSMSRAVTSKVFGTKNSICEDWLFLLILFLLKF